MKKIIFAAALCLGSTLVVGQVLPPSQFLGYELGKKFTPHYRVVDYFKHVADQSANVNLEEYGRTYENRPLLLAYIASDDNINRLEEIRQDNLKRAGLLDGSPSTQISIVWLSYNVHGNEANSTEASMNTIYKLLTEHKDWLKNTIVIIDPCINPDGRERYVNFYTQTGNYPFNPDAQSAEHDEPWPGGRQNHYLFDLNRDWAWQTQIESKARLKKYNLWMPQVHVDFHEQGYNSPYYFAPAAQPYHELITPWQREFQVRIGKNHAKYFDKNNWFYFTKQFFDLLYPSYGDTYPTYNGGIGMTYEQAGSGRAGLGIIKTEGDTLTLRDRLDRHTMTGLSTIEVSSQNSAELLSNFDQFFKTPVPGEYKSFVVQSDNQDKMQHLMTWLDMNGIRYGTANNPKGLKGYNYQSKRIESFSIGRNDLVVSVNQPKGVLAKILFEPQTKVVDSLTYDITAWSVPYFYGMKAYATGTALNVLPIKSTTKANAATPSTAYAFFFKWNSFKDAQFLSQLIHEKIKTRFLTRQMNTNGKSYSPGTIIVSKRDNKQLGNNFENTIASLANQANVSFDVSQTGFVDSGPDLGSNQVSYIDPPKVALLRGNGVSTTNYGATWFYMEQELAYPISTINLDRFNRTKLSEYQIIIMQEGRYRSIGESGMKKLMEWVSNGGKLIAIGSSISSLVDSDYADISQYSSDKEKEAMEKKEKEDDEAQRLMPYAAGEREYAKNITPGSIIRVKLDNTHPLAYGYPSVFYTLKTSASRYGYLNAQNVGIISSENDIMSGFVGKNVREAIGNSLVMGVENKGRGEIVYFVDNPLFRDFWYNYKLMFANALFFVGQD